VPPAGVHANKTLVVLLPGCASSDNAPRNRDPISFEPKQRPTATEGLPTKHSKNSKAEEGDSEFSIVSCV
jgi:hypothetical protein